MALKNKTIKRLNIALTVIAVILIVLIVPLLVISVTLIVKSVINPDYPPDIFGYAPLTVASGSMSGDAEDCFDEGDLIFVKILSDDEKQQLNMSDVICFKTDDVFVTHRIVGIKYSDDNTTIEYFYTMGDANSTMDSGTVAIDDVYGIYAGRLRHLGSFAEFLQSGVGIAVIVCVPLIAFIAFDVSRFLLKRHNSNAEKDLSEKDKEIARLKEMLNEKEALNGRGDSPDDGGGGGVNPDEGSE